MYQRRTVRALAALLETSGTRDASGHPVAPVPTQTGLDQTMLTAMLMSLVGIRWVIALAAINNVAHFPWAPTVSWWYVLVGWLVFVSPPGRIAIAAAGARLLLHGVRPGSYPRGGTAHMRLWAAEKLSVYSGATNLAGVWLTYYARALGVQLGVGVDLHSLPPVTGMLRIGKGAAVEPEVDLCGHWVDGDTVHIGQIRIGPGATVGSRSTLLPGARIGKRAQVAPGSCVTGAVPAGQRVAGVPAHRTGRAAAAWPGSRPVRRARWTLAYGITSLFLGFLPVLAALPGLVVLGRFVASARTLGAATLSALEGVPFATAVVLLTYALLVLGAVRLLGIGLRAGYHPVHGRVAWQAWTIERLMDMARVALFPLYASLFTPIWMRALGMRVGRRAEISTVVALPTMTVVGDDAFLADDTMVGSYELGGGWLRIDKARIGRRSFLGNSGMTAPGRKVPKRGLVGVLSATPKRAKAGTSWLGMPPMKLPRVVESADESRTFNPPRHLVLGRVAVEICRLVPVMCTVALAVLTLAAFEALAIAYGYGVAAAAGGLVLLLAGLVACAVASYAKVVLVGRFEPGERPLWSSFVWRNELADTFVEVVAAPWFARGATGTPVLNLWLRAMGSRIGRGVWCETYWLPEADLIELQDGATVNRGCVVQTHLFHDRMLSMAPVTLRTGATLGTNGVVLPAAVIGKHATVGPVSLVMRGESVPDGTRWIGNPIGPWAEDESQASDG